jgi:hypothetical protein
VRRPASGAERLNGSCVAAQATMPGRSDGSASTWGTLCGHRAGSDGVRAGGARHARKQGTRRRARRGMSRVRARARATGGAARSTATRYACTRRGVPGAEPALGARARGSRERREEQEGRKEKRTGREGRKREKGKRKGKGRKRKGKMEKKKGKKKWERKKKGRKRKENGEKRENDACRRDSRARRTYSARGEQRGERKTRRCQSRRRPRPVGHARAAFARGEREKKRSRVGADHGGRPHVSDKPLGAGRNSDPVRVRVSRRISFWSEHSNV